MNIYTKYIIGLLYIITSPAFSATAIDISADSAEILLKSNKHSFSGNVKLSRSTDYIHSDHMIIIKSESKSTINATSISPNLVLFNLGGGQGSGEKILFDEKSNILVITGSASIESEGSILRSDKITYIIDEDRIVTGESLGGVRMKIKQ